MRQGFLTDVTSITLAKTLDAVAARQKVIANNIANVETPGYKRSYVTFEDELRSVMETSSGRNRLRKVKELTHSSRVDVLSPTRADGNNVNIDAEIADLAKTSLNYKAAVTIMESRGAMLRSAIQGR